MAKGSIEGVFLPSSGDCDRIFKIAKSEHRRSAHEPLEHQARASRCTRRGRRGSNGGRGTRPSHQHQHQRCSRDQCRGVALFIRTSACTIDLSCIKYQQEFPLLFFRSTYAPLLYTVLYPFPLLLDHLQLGTESVWCCLMPSGILFPIMLSARYM